MPSVVAQWLPCEATCMCHSVTEARGQSGVMLPPTASWGVERGRFHPHTVQSQDEYLLRAWCLLTHLQC